MNNSQGFSISMVYPIMKTFVHKGFDFQQFCLQVSFDKSLLQDMEARIDEVELERVMNEAARYTKDDHFGLNQGQLTDIADLGILGYVMMHSNKIVDALTAYQRYNVILCNGYNLDWEEQGEDIYLRFYKLNSTPFSRHCLEDMVSSLYHLIVKMSNRRILIHEIQFVHSPPVDIAPYLSIFGVEPQFSGDGDFIRISKEVLHYPILYSDPKLRRAFELIAIEIREKLIQGREFSDRVYQWMMECMPARFPNLQQTAESFKMSTRSLQVKLKEENSSYNDLTSSVRRELAVGYLQKSEYSIAEIAYLLHFSEPSAFHNAFKKWTELTPGQYRAKFREECHYKVKTDIS